jgi:hypothetical protein
MKEIYVKSVEDNKTGEEGEEAKIEEDLANFDHMSEKILDGVCTRFPSLETFDEKIQHLSDVKEKIS